MKTATSKLTKKYQATVPESVRKILHLSAGDLIAFDIEDGGVHLRKAHPIDLLFTKTLESTMSEWESAADEKAYRNL